ncbi:MAG: DUF2892 domain-containing protein [Helicobacteraceae bacterium]|jgi:hypothetical protein|nr:DUF2892 domain-containing protein [Helicobacteraceae bacterium]
MKKNMHAIDRTARIILGGAIGAITLLNAFGPYLSWVLVAIGLILIVTGAIGVCPIYSLVKIKACPFANKRDQNDCDCGCAAAK